MRNLFTDVAETDLARLIAENPLCWIVPHAAPQAALLMPVLMMDGGTALLGHLPRMAPATAALTDDGAASFLFLGPNRYVSPAMAGRDDWAPTWNFVSARIEATVSVDPGVTREAVEAMVRAMEGTDGWTTDALGARYDDLLARIVGFRAAITHAAPRFKLGQDESDAVFGSVLDALRGTELGDWSDRVAGR